MEGTWGRRVFGTVRKGPRFTRLRLEITLQNNLSIYEVRIVANDELEQYPNLYKWHLNNMTEALIKRMESRA